MKAIVQIRQYTKGLFKKLVASQLRRNMASGVVASLINAVAALVTYPIYTHFLGLEAYGIWLVLSTFMQLALLGDLGVSNALTKLVAEEQGRDNRSAIQHYITAATAILAISGTLILAAILLATPRIVELINLSAENAETVTRLLPYVGLFTIYALLCQVYYATLAGLGRMDLANYIRSIGRASGVVIAATLVAMGSGITAMFLGTAVTCVLTHVAFAWVLRRQENVRILPSRLPSTQHLKRILSFGGGVFSASVMHQALGPFNKFLLCRFGGVASVPIYEIAFGCSQQIRSLAEMALRAIMPEVSRISAESGDPTNRIRHLERRALRYILILSGPCYLVAFLSLEPLLAVWLGEFLAKPLAPVLAVMLIGSFVNLMIVPSYYTLMGMGQIRSIFIASLVYMGTNVLVASIILMITKSITPMTLAWCVMLAFIATAMYLLYQKRRLLETIALQSRLRQDIDQALVNNAA